MAASQAFGCNGTLLMGDKGQTTFAGVNSPPHIAYLGRSRLHRSRANLIQTMHTIAALGRLGLRVRLTLPPWPRSFSVEKLLDQMGIGQRLEIASSRLLHPRWGFWPYVAWHRKELAAAATVYTRVPEISLALAKAGLTHHLEVHDVEHLIRQGLIQRLVAQHRQGTLDWLIPISRSGAAVLADHGAVQQRIHVAPSGVDLKAYSSLQPFDPKRLDCPRVVHLGRINQERGLRVFEAIAHRGLCQVWLVGGQADQIQPSRNLNVEPVTPPREVPRWYEQSDLVLLPYQPKIQTAATMSPIKLFEAMAAGRPIIASDLPTIREVLEPERTALLVEPDDLEAWLAAVRRLQKDPDLACRLAAAAKVQAAHYSWDQRARGIAGVLGLAVASA